MRDLGGPGCRPAFSTNLRNSRKHMEQPEDVRSRAIEKTIAEFDFGKVAAATAAAGWNIRTRPMQAEAALSSEDMQAIARELLTKAWDDENAQGCEYCHGGLRAWRTANCLTLQFVIEEAIFVPEIDLPR